MNNKERLLEKLKDQGFSKGIVSVFRKVDRKLFVGESYLDESYLDIALPIGNSQTISQPYTIAFMFSLLKLEKGLKVLEVGSGSGYVLALLSKFCSSGQVFGIELIEDLAKKSILRLRNYKNVKVIIGDGKKGLIKEALFDRILVSAAGKKVPGELLKQLKVGGILVMPISSTSTENSIRVVEKGKNKNKVMDISGFVFVPLK
ncbi:MAG: protein-L-isoaspartate O-methyltransferase [Nanoarchaeota archaeon]|nr:protein-L-isoaspartate O-methyltransferase [Nanoarchaeota archaeon]